MHGVGHLYTRTMHGVGHLLIGMGQPVLLRLCLGCVEVLSTLFRSVSLSLRVVCNATAGHVLLAVLLEMVSTMICTMCSGIPYTLWCSVYAYLLSDTNHLEICYHTILV